MFFRDNSLLEANCAQASFCTGRSNMKSSKCNKITCPHVSKSRMSPVQEMRFPYED